MKLYDNNHKYLIRTHAQYAMYTKKNLNIKYSLFFFIVVMLWSWGIVLFLQTNSSMRRFDNSISDHLYQKGNLSSGEIVVIGIDGDTISELDLPQRWTRAYYAEVIRNLSDFENHPAVIGIDILLEGNNDQDPEGDKKLVEAVQNAGNVVFVSQLETDKMLSFTDNGTAYLSEQQSLHRPFQELNATVVTALDSVFPDPDDYIVRDYSSSVLVDGEAIDSLGLAVAKRYAAAKGVELQYPKTEDGIWHLSFVDGSGNYSMISFLDVLQGDIDPAFFDGKIVLIGAYAQGLQDLCTVPIKGKLGNYMYGVEVHANAVDAILNGYYKQYASDQMQRVLFIACMIMYGILISMVPIALWICLVPVCSFGYIMFCQRLYESEKYALIFHPSWIPAGAFVLMSFGVILFGFRKWRARKKLYTQFGRYVDSKILSQIAKEEADLSLKGEKVSAAVMFVDICGFTTISEKLKDKPEVIVSMLNCYLDYVSSIILSNGGTIDKYIGDAVMAFWGAPVLRSAEENTQHAVESGLQIIARRDELRSSMKELLTVEAQDKGSTELFSLLNEICDSFGVAIGINTGEIIIGNIGSFKRLDYTAIGDAVNTASRLEGYKVPNSERKWKIYTSEQTLEYVRDKVKAVPLGEIKLKGKEEGIWAYEIIDNL